MCCSSPEEPQDLIGKEKMIEVMTDVHLLESKINLVPIVPKDSGQLIYNHYESLLFEEHKITKAQYELSFNYYLDNPNEFQKIYDAVVDSLLQKEKLTE